MNGPQIKLMDLLLLWFNQYVTKFTSGDNLQNLKYRHIWNVSIAPEWEGLMGGALRVKLTAIIV
jgi:hypothetical protein